MICDEGRCARRDALSATMRGGVRGEMLCLQRQRRTRLQDSALLGHSQPARVREEGEGGAGAAEHKLREA
eukprot:2722325-Rhodomonas_salina.1